MTQVSIDAIINGYLKLREKRAALKKAFTEEDDKLKAQSDKLRAFLMDHMDKNGATQLASDSGTAYKKRIFKPRCTGWVDLWDWLAENRRFDMLEKRLSAKAIEEYAEETDDLPPGVTAEVEYDVVIRRK